MKMKNILLSVVTTSTLFAFGSQANNSSASTWHKGVPKKSKDIGLLVVKKVI